MGGATWAFVAVAIVFAAACQRQAERPPHVNPTLGTLPAPTTTTNPYSPVPLVIDAEYVNRVLAGLDQATGDVTRIVVSARNIPQEVIDRLRTVYDSPLFLQIRLDGYSTELRDGLSVYRPNPGNRKTTVTELITIRRTCIFARVHRDSSAVSERADPRLATQWVALVPKAIDDPVPYNPTPWAYRYDGFERGLLQPEDPCNRP